MQLSSTKQSENELIRHNNNNRETAVIRCRMITIEGVCDLITVQSTNIESMVNPFAITTGHKFIEIFNLQLNLV